MKKSILATSLAFTLLATFHNPGICETGAPGKPAAGGAPEKKGAASAPKKDESTAVQDKNDPSLRVRKAGEGQQAGIIVHDKK